MKNFYSLQGVENVSGDETTGPKKLGGGGGSAKKCLSSREKQAKQILKKNELQKVKNKIGCKSANDKLQQA